jgi:hypothetical protein
MEKYSQDWDRYRKLRIQSRLAILSFPIFVAAEQFVNDISSHLRIVRTVASILLLGWFVAVIIVAERATAFGCPRCKKKFSRTWWQTNGLLFARHCAYCGLQRYA